mmetsp:Transcript_47/g.409  ORF Transcript_47/g.409 Transcript_47/m.409 type:complete len:272 (-) Transcript_47:484-1299(-)
MLTVSGLCWCPASNCLSSFSFAWEQCLYSNSMCVSNQFTKEENAKYPKSKRKALLTTENGPPNSSSMSDTPSAKRIPPDIPRDKIRDTGLDSCTRDIKLTKKSATDMSGKGETTIAPRAGSCSSFTGGVIRPSGVSSDAIASRKHSKTAAAKVVQVAVVEALTSARLAGTNSAKTIQIIHPAAKPIARGRQDRNVSTNRKEGTAMKGCGSEVSTLQQAACLGDIPLPIRTVATASPSGMLWIPMAKVTKMPSTHPLFPLKDTPTPAPSAKE